jgi:predicted nucleic acid-binding protein
VSPRGRPLVVDASAVLDLMLQLRRAHRIGELISSPFAQSHVPDTIDREVINVLRKHERSGALTTAEAEGVFRDFVAMPFEIHDARTFAGRVWELRSVCSVGDAYYVALAEALDATLITSDEKLARGVAPLNVDVLVP